MNIPADRAERVCQALETRASVSRAARVRMEHTSALQGSLEWNRRRARGGHRTHVSIDLGWGNSNKEGVCGEAGVSNSDGAARVCGSVWIESDPAAMHERRVFRRLRGSARDDVVPARLRSPVSRSV
jgi:hypothetical protein